MSKPTDGDTPAGKKPEETAGTPEISWQSAMDPPTAAPGDVPSESVAETVAETAEKSALEFAGTAPAEDSAPVEEPGTVDFVLASTPAEPEKAAEESAFGNKAKDADALWASLGRDGAAKTEEAARSAPDEGVRGLPGIPPLTAASSTAAKDKKGDKAKKGKEPKPRVPSSGPFAGKAFGPVIAAKPMMRDEDDNLVPTPPTLTSRLFTVLALIPIILPVVLFLAQVACTLDVRALWYSDEVRYAAAYRSMVDSGNWLVMHLNGAMYPDKPPLFFWFLYGLEEALKAIQPFIPFAVTVTANTLFFAGVAISGLLCLLATHAMASLVARVDRRTVLAADLVLVSCFFFASLAHYLRMDLLFTACITVSHVFLFHALVREKAPLLMVLGYLFAGAAVLVKGPLGLALPVLAGLCFLIWQGRILRFFRIDSLFGLLIGLAVPGVWLALAWMNAGDAFLNNILHKQVLARALDTWHHAEPWYHYLMTLPLIWLPWTLVLLFLPWGRFMNKGMREGLKASRTKDAAGIAYLWCAFLPGAILLSLVSIKLPIYCLPLFPPLAVLTARAVLQMRPFAAGCLQYTLAFVLLALGLGLVLMPAAPGNYLPLPYVPKGVMVLGGICLFFACALAFLIKPRRGEGTILLLAIFATVFMYPAWTVTAPSLDAFMSPKAQADVIKTYRDAGYYPVTFKVYGGTYTYYAGNMRDCQSWEDVTAQAEKNPKMILAMRASLWDKMENKPEGFAEVHRQTIAERDYVLVARPPLGGKTEAPAAPETPAAPAGSAPATPEAPAPAAPSGEAAPEPAAPAAEAAAPATGASPAQGAPAQ